MFLQLSWLVPALVILSDSPDHEPTPVPEGIWAATVAVPLIEKSACVHGGFVASACTLNAVTVAVTDAMYTLPAFGLVKLPDNALGAPRIQTSRGDRLVHREC